MSRKKAKRKKRTITPEHLAKMQEGKKYAKRKREIEADVASLEKRVFERCWLFCSTCRQLET